MRCRLLAARRSTHRDHPHRSVSARHPGLDNGDGAPAQLWTFWLAPLIGAAIASVGYPYLFGGNEELADQPVRDDALEDADAATS
jgi:hypothetical protein